MTNIIIGQFRFLCWPVKSIQFLATTLCTSSLFYGVNRVLMVYTECVLISRSDLRVHSPISRHYSLMKCIEIANKGQKAFNVVFVSITYLNFSYRFKLIAQSFQNDSKGKSLRSSEMIWNDPNPSHFFCTKSTY
jgi:hypothetical protein